MTPHLVALAVQDAPAVKHKAVLIGVGIMDQSWQLLGGVHWMFRGFADFLAIDIQGRPGVEQQRRIKLAVGSLMTGKRRRALSFWTDAAHQEAHPGDKFFERTMKYSQQIQKNWPKF